MDISCDLCYWLIDYYHIYIYSHEYDYDCDCDWYWFVWMITKQNKLKYELNVDDYNLLLCCDILYWSQSNEI